MGRLSTAWAMCLAVGAVAASTAPAQALAAGEDPCAADPRVQTCVDDAFGQAIGALETVRSIYNNLVCTCDPSPVCTIYMTITGKPCPDARSENSMAHIGRLAAS